MKIINFITGFLFLYGLASCQNAANSKNNQTIAMPDTSSPKTFKTQTNTFNDLRSMAFTVTAEQLQLSLPADKTIVYGIIMDWGIDSATATIVSYLTGDASMYLSSGGAIIGGGQHQNVNSAAKQFVALAQSYLDKVTKTDSDALPMTDEVKFYFLTNKGRFAGQEIMKNFENNSSTWLPLFEEGNKVLSELRITSEK